MRRARAGRRASARRGANRRRGRGAARRRRVAARPFGMGGGGSCGREARVPFGGALQELDAAVEVDAALVAPALDKALAAPEPMPPPAGADASAQLFGLDLDAPSRPGRRGAGARRRGAGRVSPVAAGARRNALARSAAERRAVPCGSYQAKRPQIVQHRSLPRSRRGAAEAGAMRRTRRHRFAAGRDVARVHGCRRSGGGDGLLGANRRGGARRRAETGARRRRRRARGVWAVARGGRTRVGAAPHRYFPEGVAWESPLWTWARDEDSI